MYLSIEKRMSKLLEQLKKNASKVATTTRAALLPGKIIQVDRGAKSVVCKNHRSPDGKSTMKVIIPVIPKMKEYNCSCGTIYKFV